MNRLVLTLVGALCLVSAAVSVESTYEWEADSDWVFEDDIIMQTEQEMPSDMDESFMKEKGIIDDELTPKDQRLPLPDLSDEQIYNGSLTIEGKDLRSANPYVSHYKAWWFQSKRECCPREWNYGCRSYRTRLACFWNWGSYCCPIVPRVYTSHCLCNNCMTEKNGCAVQGKCAKRYTKRWFVASCWGGIWGWSLHWMHKWVPSSCYCSA